MQLPDGLLPEELMWKVQSFLQHPTAEVIGKEITSWNMKQEQATQEFMMCVCAEDASKHTTWNWVINKVSFYQHIFHGICAHHQCIKSVCFFVLNREPNP